MKQSRDGTQSAMNNNAAFLNNTAVSLMLDGDFDKAAPLLARALAVSREAMLRAPSTSTSDEDSFCKKSASTTEFSLDKCMIQSPSIDCEAPEDNIMMAARHQQELLQENHPYYIYRKAILIPMEDLSSFEDFESSTLVSVAIVFNLALLHHLLAAKHHQMNHQRICSQTEQQLLTKAVKLYDLALSLHSQETNIDSPVYIMACVNNLGLIYQHLSETVRANSYFQHLLQTLMFLVDCRQQPGDVAMLAGFLRNATGQICPNTAAPAA